VNRTEFRSGTEILLDATHGIAVLTPGAENGAIVSEILNRIPDPTATPAVVERAPSVTRDGVPIEVLLNISDPTEAGSVTQLASAGVGLFRTEFLYMDRLWWPTEEESLEIYRDVASQVGPAELNIRLVDFGAEKCPPYADIPLNRNPSLGLRGIRLLLQREDILRPQVRALAQLGRERKLTVLLPMLDTLDTLTAAIETLCRLCGCRDRAHLPFRLGTMIEVPTAALMIQDIVEQVDDVSIGLNDLTQYLLAADRDDEFVETYHDPMQPAVLRIVHALVQAANAAGKPVTICGELAGDPRLTGLLLALGIRRLSVSRSSYSQIVQAVRSLTLESVQKSIEKVLKFTSGADVRSFVMQRMAPS